MAPSCKLTTQPPNPELPTPSTLLLLLGDQLDPAYPDHLGITPAEHDILMVEVREASTCPPSHVQRTILFLAAMRHHAAALRDKGWTVHYHAITDEANTHTFTGELTRALRQHRPDRLVVIQPGDFAVQDAIESACTSTGIPLDIREDPHFLCTIDEFNDWADSRSELIMEYFYRQQRRKLDILMTSDGKPVGGDWNYDKQNRKSFKRAPNLPARPDFSIDDITRQVIDDVHATLPDLPGTADGFNWPVTRRQALYALRHFIEHHLPHFGDHQDAMWTDEHTLHHSLLAAPLNLKLINPREVCDAALDAWTSDHAPLNSVEGFIRQIIGWREFIRGVYFNQGPTYPERNELEHTNDLPEFYWTGETDMNCMAHALRSVLDLGYGHHIARLMVTGNFALIAGINPQQVNDWYRGMYVDAIDWVTTPNTVGMALHADGGIVGTKPYAASGKYINRMSNYCKACRYDVNARTGDTACPFNILYWNFLLRHRKRFSSNRRMTMILKNLDRLTRQEKTQITLEGKRITEQT